MTRAAHEACAFGAARLEFALTLVLVSLLAALALQRIAELQRFARHAEARTAAAQARATHAVDEARKAIPARSGASAPRPFTPAQTPLAGAAP